MTIIKLERKPQNHIYLFLFVGGVSDLMLLADKSDPDEYGREV